MTADGINPADGSTARRTDYADGAKEKMKLRQMRPIGGNRVLLRRGSTQIIKAIRVTPVENEEK